jgi:hypothetical protein
LRRRDKFLVQYLLARRKKQVLRRWLRHAENLNDIEEIVCICEPEVGENLSDEEERSRKDLVDC